ncbi:MAG TPA: hypothetical protein VFJ00_02900 [Candidatus Limnocylindria bacterium]|nr:hypothetical protein [Candidatus Limnocylindria bacterium]
MTEPIGSDPRPTGMLRRLLSVAFLLGLAMLAAPLAQVRACSCPQMDRAAALGSADVAFVGVVASIDDPSVGPMVSSGDPLRYSFAVEKAIKGELSDTVGVLSARSGASCGMEFALAQRWRVFAYVDETGHLQSHLCSGNELLAEGVPVPPSTPEPTPPPVAALLAIGAVLGLAGFTAWAFTRRPGAAG